MARRLRCRSRRCFICRRSDRRVPTARKSSMSGVTAVLDIGKTNVKVASFAADGTLLWERVTPNRAFPGPPYPHADVESIWDFLLESLEEANRVSGITTIVATTHGCAAALVDDSGLVLPVMDYEFSG